MKEYNLKVSGKQTAFSWWFFFIALFLFEFLLFRTYILREVVSYYPAYFDQLNYLDLSYALYESILHNGLIQGMIITFNQYSISSTVLFYIQAAIFFLFTGASRYYALLLNFIYFIILQVSIVIVVKKLTGRYLFAVLFLGLLFLSLTPYLHAGGPIDFRMDFMVFCLYGIFVSVVLGGGIFLDKKWTVVAGCLAGLLILLRIFTFTYISGISILLACFFLMGGKKNHLAKRRFENILIFIVTFLFISLPILWLMRKGIYDYYVVGHILGPEKYIRSGIEGAFGTLALLLYYPKSIIFHHLGFKLIGCCSALLLIIFAGYKTAKVKLSFYLKHQLTYFKEGLVFLGLAILVPFTLLTLDLSKSPIVAGILTVPIIWLIIWVSIYYYQKQNWAGAKKYLIYSIVVISFLVGMCHYTLNFIKHDQFYYKENVQNITKMYEDIGDYAINHHWDRVEIAVDQTNEYLSNVSLSVLYYERRHVVIKTGLTLGNDSCSYVTLEKALHEIAKSAVFIVNLGDYEQGGRIETPWPLSTSLKTIRPQLRQYAERHLSKLGDYSFDGYTFRVYVRP